MVRRRARRREQERPEGRQHRGCTTARTGASGRTERRLWAGRSGTRAIPSQRYARPRNCSTAWSWSVVVITSPRAGAEGIVGLGRRPYLTVLPQAISASSSWSPKDGATSSGPGFPLGEKAAAAGRNGHVRSGATSCHREGFAPPSNRIDRTGGNVIRCPIRGGDGQSPLLPGGAVSKSDFPGFSGPRRGAAEALRTGALPPAPTTPPPFAQPRQYRPARAERQPPSPATA